jgi:hypothetical protein
VSVSARPQRPEMPSSCRHFGGGQTRVNLRADTGN